MTDSPWGPGTVLAGRFLLEDLLDETDGAYFWRATDQVLARSVGVHLLRADDPRADALLDAARTSALVSDMRLLRVLDAASAEGVVYVVNEWSQGLSMDLVVAEGPMPANRAAWVVREVAETIAAAHRVGVAHGRLLPENVIVSDAGPIKLVGFVVDAVLRSPDGQRRVTDGEPVSAAESDVLNLAGLLYAALVGRWPGTEGSKVPTAPIEHGRALRPRRVRAGVPRSLDALCAQVLSDPPGTGVPIDTAHEVHAALSDYIGDPTGSSLWTRGPQPTVALDRDLPGSDASSSPPSVEADAPTVSVPWPGGGRAGADGRSGDAADEAGPDDDTGELRGTGGTGEQVDPGDDTGELDETAAHRAPGTTSHPFDPDATQAAPMVFDDDSGSHRLIGQGAPAARGAGPRRRTPAGRRPAPEPPEAVPRPLFVDDVPTSRTGAPTSSGGAAPTDTDGQEDTGSFIGHVEAVPGPVPDASGSGWGHPDPSDSDRHPAGSGTAWGPALDPPGGAGGGAAAGGTGRRWLRGGALLLVAALVAAGTIVTLNLRDGTSADPGPAAPSGDASSSQGANGRPVPIADVRDFDPEGDPSEENPDLVARAHDGDPSTAWRTLVYRGDPQLGKLKSGVGLLVDLGKQAEVAEVRLRLAGSPTAVRILTDPGAARAPADVTGLRPAAREPEAGERARLRFDEPVRTRWLVVWLTSLPPSRGGYQGQVAEVSVRS